MQSSPEEVVPPCAAPLSESAQTVRHLNATPVFLCGTSQPRRRHVPPSAAVQKRRQRPARPTARRPRRDKTPPGSGEPASSHKIRSSTRAARTVFVHFPRGLFAKEFFYAGKDFFCAGKEFFCAVEEFFCAAKEFFCAAKGFCCAVEEFFCAAKELVSATKETVCAGNEMVCATTRCVGGRKA